MKKYKFHCFLGTRGITRTYSHNHTVFSASYTAGTLEYDEDEAKMRHD